MSNPLGSIAGMPQEDYVIVNGEKKITRWQKCIHCGQEVFTWSPPDQADCGECGGRKQTTGKVKSYPKESIPNDIRWAVWERDNFTCKKCGSRKDLTVDHIFPESKGCRATLDNC